MKSTECFKSYAIFGFSWIGICSQSLRHVYLQNFYFSICYNFCKRKPSANKSFEFQMVSINSRVLFRLRTLKNTTKIPKLPAMGSLNQTYLPIHLLFWNIDRTATSYLMQKVSYHFFIFSFHFDTVLRKTALFYKLSKVPTSRQKFWTIQPKFCMQVFLPARNLTPQKRVICILLYFLNSRYFFCIWWTGKFSSTFQVLPSNLRFLSIHLTFTQISLADRFQSSKLSLNIQ